MDNSLISRDLTKAISKAFDYLPIITLTGPRQSGKTTLCRELFPDLPYTSLELVSTLAEVKDDPIAFLHHITSFL